MSKVSVESRAAEPAFPPGVAYVDGRFCPMSEAKISVLDWGFLRSDATYDVVHVWEGRFFRLDKHVERFLASAASHATAGLASVTGDHYEGGHWLGSFATYLVTRRGLSSQP